METPLDESLALSAPVVVRRTPELVRDLHTVVVDAEAQAAKSRRHFGRRMGVASLVTAAVFGAGAAANAAGLIPMPTWGFDEPSARQIVLALPSGTSCEVTYAVGPQETAPQEDQARALGAAQDFLGSFDISTISTAEAVAKYQAAAAAARRELERLVPANELPPRETRDDVQVRAVGAELYARLDAELTSQGIPSGAVTMSSMHRCELGSAQ